MRGFEEKPEYQVWPLEVTHIWKSNLENGVYIKLKKILPDIFNLIQLFLFYC